MSKIATGTAAASAQVENVNNSVNNESSEDKNSKNKKNRKPISKCDQVLVYARRKFFALPKEIQTLDLRQKFILAGMHNFNISEKEFYGEYNLQLCILLESVKFVDDCKVRNLCPFIVAQTVLFSGMSYVMRVIKEGLETVFPNLYSVDMNGADKALIQYSTLKEYDGNLRLNKVLIRQEIKCGLDAQLQVETPKTQTKKTKKDID